MGDWKDLFTGKQDTVTSDPVKPRTWKELFGTTDSIPSVSKNIPQLPEAPRWNNVIDPAQKRVETADNVGEFIIGGVAKFDEALAGMFNQLDYVQTSLSDAINTILVGKETANGIKDIRKKYGVDVAPSGSGKPSINSIRPFKAVSNAIDWSYSGAKPLPDTMMGDIVGGIGAIGPEIIAAAVAPEIKAGQLLTSWGLPIFSKFGTVMAAEGFASAMEESEGSTTMRKLTMPFVSAFEQYATGQMYDFMGAMSSKLGGKLASKFVPEAITATQAHTSMLIHSLGTTSFNALMFGGHGTLSEFLETGKSSWRTFGTGAGMGIGLGAREVGKTLWAKGMHSLVASDMDMIRRASESEVSADEMISHAKNKTKAVENKTSKNPEGDMASAVLTTNTAVLKSVVEEIKKNPQEVLKSVEESTLPPEVKKQITEKVNQISAELDPMVQQSKPMTDKIADIDAQMEVIKKNDNIPPEVQKIKITYLEEKRDKLVSQVVKLSQEPKPVSDEKKAEDTKQARMLESKAAQVFPQFQAKGEELATEFGGRFESRLKSVESTTGKTAREGIEVSGVTDTMGGAIIVGDMKDFKAVSKRLKKEGYSISNKRLANKDTGRKGVFATKTEDGVGMEIQLHTEKTWEAQKKAEAIRDKYRKEGIPPVDVVDVETNPAKYKAEDQIKSHEEFGGSTFSVGGENLAGKKGKASVGIFPERSETITKTVISEEQKAMAEPKFPEGMTPDVQKRKSGKDKVSLEDAEGNEVSSITFKTVKVNEDKYWSIQQAATATGSEGKGHATNLYKYAMQNLPEGYKGIISPASSRQNTTQIPKIHEKLSKLFDMQTNENGDIIFRPKTEGLTPEEIKAFIEKNKDILEGNEDILSVGTWKKSSGEHVLDITATPSREKAIELGKKYNQESIFDLEKMEEVPTGGTGKNIDPATGKEYSSSIEDRVKELRVTPRSIYEDAMAESRRVYEEAYTGLEDVDLEGSPAKTALEKKMKVLEIPMSQQKELKKAWTETKQKLLGELKGKNAEIKQTFEDFINTLSKRSGLGLNIKLKPAMLRKVNDIDFTKPKSIDRAIEYFDKIIDDATFRLNVVEYQRAMDKLYNYTSPDYLLKKVNSILKNKLGPSGLPLADELKSIHKDMIEGDWQRGQDAIKSMMDIYIKENRDFTEKELNHVARLSFQGLLNATNRADLREIQGAVNSLKEIIKTGKTKAAARRMIEREAQTALDKNIFDVIDGDPSKPVQLDQHIATNERVGLVTRMARHLNWMQMDSWFSLLDKFSKFDKKSDPYKSVLNKVLGGAVVEADLNEFRAKREKFTEVQDKFKEIFGVSKPSKIRKIARENTTTLHDLTFKNLVGGEETRKITMNQAYKVYMELQDPSLMRANEAGGWMREGDLTSKGEALMKLLTPEIKAWADWQLNEFYPKYYDRINEVYRRIYGTDMPMGEKYSPIFVTEKVGVKEGGSVDDMLVNNNITSTASNGSLKTRVNHDKPLALIDGDKVMTNYIEKMEYFINWSDAMRLLNDTFVRNGDIRAALRQKFGPTSLQVVDNFLNDFARAPKDLNRATKWVDNFRRNFTVASLAIKPTVFFAQMTAVPAYLEQVPVGHYAKQLAKSMVDWKGNKEIWDIIKEDPFWKERYQKGWDRDVIDAMQKDLQTVQGRNALGKFRDMSMFLTKYGDMGAILIGGIPLYRYEYSKALKETGNEKLARAQAMAAFTDATRNSQQAGQTYDLSVVQRANSFTKLLTMYKTSPFSYHRKVAGAMRNLAHGRGNVTANAKTIFIYHVLLPQIFQMVGNGFKWQKEDQLQALALGNFNDVFVAGDIIKGLTNTMRGLPFPYQASPVESTGRTAQQALQHLDSSNLLKAVLDQEENVSMEDVFKAIEDLSKVAGDVSGMPVRGAYAIGKGVYDVSTGALEDADAMHKAARIMGWSESALQENSKNIFDDDLTHREVKDLMEDIKNPTLDKIYKLEDNRLKKSTGKPLPGKSQKGMPAKKDKPLPSK